MAPGTWLMVGSWQSGVRIGPFEPGPPHGLHPGRGDLACGGLPTGAKGGLGPSLSKPGGTRSHEPPDGTLSHDQAARATPHGATTHGAGPGQRTPMVEPTI